ncbi:hypothetical protein [Geminocystis sp. GBBB08]|uniref:hypothetical protein n=1 Tax=Geminocystis sp. GBBB08 TaxID=2604140 RepID=UPI0027E2A89A|nr:hypothetical protein [Geminocystis sp. GBBB08]MBL1210236.1 hypothetical protein [Geminocystis sp. GBBB08]
MTTTADDVWQLLAELANAQKETERRFQETERRFQETERILKEQSQKTDRQIKQVNEQIGKLGNRLGEFVEWQVRPCAVELFRSRGIDVHELQSDVSVKRIDGGLEIDLLVVNDTDVVLVEVKSKLSQRDVDEHLERLSKFKKFMPRYQNMRAFGAVAAMVVSDQVAHYAYGKGLFVLAQSGDTMKIVNSTEFKPQAW